MQGQKFALFYWTCSMFVLEKLSTCRTSAECLTPTPNLFSPQAKDTAVPGQPFPHIPINSSPFPCLLFLFISLSFLLFPQCAVEASGMEDAWSQTTQLWSGWQCPQSWHTAYIWVCCQSMTHYIPLALKYTWAAGRNSAKFKSFVSQVVNSLTRTFSHTCTFKHMLIRTAKSRSGGSR